MFIEHLEVRALFSVSTVVPVPPINLNTQIAIDRLKIRADLLKFRSDSVGAMATLLGDVAALKAADLKQDATLAPLFKTFRSHVAAMQLQLKSDNLTESAAVLQDRAAIDLELLKIIADHGNAAALKADHAVLLADRIEVQKDEIAGLDARLLTRQTEYTTLFNDLTAITKAIGTDTGASPALTAAVNKFSADRGTILNTFAGDLSTIIADRTKLVTDLTTLQNQA